MYVTKDEVPLALEYNEMQDQVFNVACNQYRFVVLAKGRRSGGTTGAINYIIEKCVENQLHVLWCDTVQQNLVPLYQRYFYPVISKFRTEFYKYRKQVHELDLFNSHIYFRSSEKPESLEGFFFDVVVLNESGLILKGERGRRLWYNSIYPMLLDRAGQAIFIGTPKGKRGKKDEDSPTSLFYELYLKGLNKEPDWVSFKYSSYCNIDMLARQITIDRSNKGIVLTHDQALKIATDNINTMAADFPLHIRQQEIYAEFIDKTEESVFHEDWFDIVPELPSISDHKQVIISMDTAFKIGESNDYSAAVVILQTNNGHYYITDLINERYEFPQLLQATKDLYTRNSNARYMLIEDKASGIPLLQVLKQETTIPVKAIKVSTDKLTRANACSTVFEQHKVHLLQADWNQTLIDQLCQFNGLFDSDDDIVDACSQGLNFLNQGAGTIAPVISKRVIRTSSALRGYNV